jgi:hypothetical protein
VASPEVDTYRAAVLTAYNERYKSLLAKISAYQNEVSQTGFCVDNTSNGQSVTLDFLAGELANSPKETPPTWRGMLVQVRDSLELSTEFERNRLAKLPLGQMLQVSSEPYPGFCSDDWRVLCDIPGGGQISVPCAWLEVAVRI